MKKVLSIVLIFPHPSFIKKDKTIVSVTSLIISAKALIVNCFCVSPAAKLIDAGIAL